MGLLNIYSSISKLRPHITYRFCAAISPFGSSSVESDEVVNFAIKSVTFPTFNIANDTKRLFGNTQVSFPTFKFGEREMSITFEETDDMSVFNTLSTYYTNTPYFNESLPLISIKITQFEESMNTVVDEKTYVCRIKQFDFPTFNNNEYGSPISLKASFYVLYSTSDEKSLNNIKHDKSGEIKHQETHGNLDNIFGEYMENLGSAEHEEDLKSNSQYREQYFGSQYNELNEKRNEKLQTIRRQLIEVHNEAMKNDAAYKEDFEKFKKTYKGEANTVAEVEAFLKLDLKYGSDPGAIGNAINKFSENEQTAILEKALIDLNELDTQMESIKSEEKSYAPTSLLTNNNSKSTSDFEVSDAELVANLNKIHSKGYTNVTMETLRTVSLENASRMKTAYNGLKSSLSDSPYTIDINTYNDPKHGFKTGTASGSHLTGQKVDLTFYKNGQKLSMNNISKEDREFLSKAAKENNLIINWEADTRKTDSGWGDVALANALTINKQGKAENINLKKWTKDDKFYDSATDSHKNFKQEYDYASMNAFGHN